MCTCGKRSAERSVCCCYLLDPKKGEIISRFEVILGRVRVDMMESENQNSSAYSSLTNSTNEISEAVTIVPNNNSPIQHRTHNTSIEIRNIIDDYNATLKRATKEIKALTLEKQNLEKEYEKLLTLNENLAADLENTLRQKKLIQQDQKTVLKANEELYQEAQRLSDIETKWTSEKEHLESEVAKLSKELEDLDRSSCVSEVLAHKNSKAVESLQNEKTEFVATIAKLEMENKQLRREAKLLAEEREDILSRNEQISGENMQMIVESQEFGKIKTEMAGDLKDLKSKYKDLERENNRLKIKLDDAQIQTRSPLNEEKVAKLVEQNKNLTEWREQLIEKNHNLSDENKKLRGKCANLEELLNEEETDINDVLELIRTMQLASKNGTNPGPISPMSAIGAKLRDMK